MRLRNLTLLSAALALSACSSTEAVGPSEYVALADDWNSSLTGELGQLFPGLDVSLSLTQDGSVIGGSFAIRGTVADTLVVLDLAGTVSGTVTSGPNPSVDLSIRNSACPDYSARFTGAYDSGKRQLTVTGPLDFFRPDSCSVGFSAPVTLVFKR